jgi:voltage-gated sodium channel
MRQGATGGGLYTRRGPPHVLEKLRAIVEDPRTDRVIMTLIIINAITLGLQTSKTVMAAYGPILEFFDDLIVGIFVVEVAARLIVHRSAFFRDPWSVFDFIVVAISLVPAGETFSVLRSLRVLRLLRLITVVPTLKAVVGGLLAALPGMGSIVLLIGLLYYVFSVIAVKLYGTDFPELFGTLGQSFFTLFTVMTLEGWVEGVVKPIMEKFPRAWLFFIIFIVVTTFMVLNLFIGVVVNAMQKEHEKVEAAELEAEREIIHDETAPILKEIRSLKAEVAELRKALAGKV